ncbi:hypothetical protein [Litoreibacter arenae]|uniref:hypothetical protein n=1 Tax=Litoreibacter arenae TaxID=491388 RepID=UPI000593BB7C|nr:hypothetical protein [Litoreibacter arenae]
MGLELTGWRKICLIGLGCMAVAGIFPLVMTSSLLPISTPLPFGLYFLVMAVGFTFWVLSMLTGIAGAVMFVVGGVMAIFEVVMRIKARDND